MNKKTQHISKFALGFIASLLTVSQVAQATGQVPQIINYQSQFMKSATEFEDRKLDIRFSFWNDATFDNTDITGTGAVNTSATSFAGFVEEFTNITPNIEGVVNLEMGSTVALPAIDPSIHKYLQVEVKLNGESDDKYEVLDPTGTLGDAEDRRGMLSVPYALNTGMLNGHSTGTGSGDIAVLNEDAQIEIPHIPGGTNEDTFIIDADQNALNNISLQFGGSGSLNYDPLQNIFDFSTSVDFDHNESFNFVLQNSPTALSGAVAGQLYYNTNFDEVHYYDGTQWHALGSGTGTSSSEDSIILDPEFGATFQEDGTNNKGWMEADFEDVGSDVYAYYQWNSNKPTLQDIDLQAHISLPKNYVSLKSGANLRINYQTEVDDILESYMELTAMDPAGDLITLSGTTTFTSSGTWETAMIELDDTNLLPEEELILNFKMFAREGNHVKLGKILLDYIKM